MMDATLVLNCHVRNQWDWEIVVKGRMRITEDLDIYYSKNSLARRAAETIAKELGLTITKEETE